jgi:hypothetical protein
LERLLKRLAGNATGNADATEMRMAREMWMARPTQVEEGSNDRRSGGARRVGDG